MLASTYKTENYNIASNYNYNAFTDANNDGLDDVTGKPAVSLNKIYDQAVGLGKFKGSFKDFIAKYDADIQSKTGVFAALDETNINKAKDLIHNFFGRKGETAVAPIDNKPMEDSRVVKFMPNWAFYTGITVAAVGVGYGLFRAYKHYQVK